MAINLKGKDFATRQIHAGQMDIPGIQPLAMPIFQTSSFAFESSAHGAALFSGEESGYFYSRMGNPNQVQAGAKIAELENAEAGIVLSSGMGAIATVFWTALREGGHILADKTLYGCTFALLTHGITSYGVETTLIDFTELENIKKNLREDTKVVYFETPANPTMKILDIEAITEAVHAYNPQIKVVIDNTFATPYLQRPIELGVDVVVHSGTKYLNGHGDVLSGMIVGKKDFVNECLMFGVKDMTGSVASPFDCYLLCRGMRTLDIRMEKHCQNAMAIAEFLEGHHKVSKVYYPGLKSAAGYEIAKKQMKLPGGIMAFELKADRAGSERFINFLELCTLAVSLGDVETLIQHPASMTHSAYSATELAEAGITENLIRLSVGLEGADDIICDLKEALARI